MTRTLAGWEMGLVKLAEAARATAIMRSFGSRPNSVEVPMAMGAMMRTRAVVGTMVVARAVSR